MFNNESCFVNTLKLIDALQRKSEDNTKCDITCTKPFLGDAEKAICLNTRPVTFYRCDNSLISVELDNGHGPVSTSSVFRVENVTNNCVTCRILVPALANTVSDADGASRCHFIATDQTTIINLDCVCALKCLTDTYVNL